MYSVYQDIKERLVDGYIWLILLLLAIPANIIRLVLYWSRPEILLISLISIVFGLFIALFMGFFGLWGGADVLALICITLMNPIPISLIDTTALPLLDQLLSYIFPLSLIIVINAVLIQLPLPIIIFLHNYRKKRQFKIMYALPIESNVNKFFANFLGEPLAIKDILAKPIFYYQVLEKERIPNTKVQYIESMYPVPFVRLCSEELVRWKMFRKEPQIYQNFNILQFKRNQFIDMLNTNPKNHWKLDFSIGLKSEEEDMYRQRTVINSALFGRQKRNFLWVQYSVPFLLPMVIGFFLGFWGVNFLVEIFKILGYI